MVITEFEKPIPFLTGFPVFQNLFSIIGIICHCKTILSQCLWILNDEIKHVNLSTGDNIIPHIRCTSLKNLNYLVCVESGFINQFSTRIVGKHFTYFIGLSVPPKLSHIEIIISYTIIGVAKNST